MPGAFAHVGKDAFRKKINNENFVGVPTITIKNVIAEGDQVAAEGEVRCKKKDGGMFDAFFFDIYRLENGKIKEMRSYIVEKKLEHRSCLLLCRDPRISFRSLLIRQVAEHFIGVFVSSFNPYY